MQTCLKIHSTAHTCAATLTHKNSYGQTCTHHTLSGFSFCLTLLYSTCLVFLHTFTTLSVCLAFLAHNDTLCLLPQPQDPSSQKYCSGHSLQSSALQLSESTHVHIYIFSNDSFAKVPLLPYSPLTRSNIPQESILISNEGSLI